MNWREQLAAIVGTVPASDRADLVGELARHQAITLMTVNVTDSPAPSDDEYLTADEVAEMCKASRSWVYRHRDVLRGRKLSGRVLRFRRSAVERYLESRR
jgi:excisionase family DNA binding protein